MGIDKSIVCLNNIGGNKYQIVDCETGEPLTLGKSGKVKKPRKLSWWNLCIQEHGKDKGFKGAATYCKGRKSEYINKV